MVEKLQTQIKEELEKSGKPRACDGMREYHKKAAQRLKQLEDAKGKARSTTQIQYYFITLAKWASGGVVQTRGANSRIKALPSGAQDPRGVFLLWHRYRKLLPGTALAFAIEYGSGCSTEIPCATHGRFQKKGNDRRKHGGLSMRT